MRHRSRPQRRRVLGCDSTGAAERRSPTSEVRGGGGRSYPTSQVRGGLEEQPHIQRVVAVQAQEGLEELYHLKARKGGGEEYPSSKVRSSGCALLEQL